MPAGQELGNVKSVRKNLVVGRAFVAVETSLP